MANGKENGYFRDCTQFRFFVDRLELILIVTYCSMRASELHSASKFHAARCVHFSLLVHSESSLICFTIHNTQIDGKFDRKSA